MYVMHGCTLSVVPVSRYDNELYHEIPFPSSLPAWPEYRLNPRIP